MTRKERLLATVRGEPADRPPVCFYELDGITQNYDDPDPYNIYQDPSWRQLLDLTTEKSDRIVLVPVKFLNEPPDPVESMTEREQYFNEKGDACTKTVIHAEGRDLVQVTARNKDVDTVWVLEHFIKDLDDFKSWIDLPRQEFGGSVDVSSVLAVEEELGDAGIVCLDMADPLCEAASQFDLAEYTITALTEPALFHQALEKAGSLILQRTEAIAKALPGRLWRIYGPEYASPPYLPPRLFHEYVVKYDTPIVDMIKKYGGYPRMHIHGNVKDLLDAVVAAGCTGIDPLEPAPQGDVTLRYVRERYGDALTLFGNLELSDIETMAPKEFRGKVETALAEGTAGSGRGFVLMPSASPIGRKLRRETFENYKLMIDIAEHW